MQQKHFNTNLHTSSWASWVISLLKRSGIARVRVGLQYVFTKVTRYNYAPEKWPNWKYTTKKY